MLVDPGSDKPTRVKSEERRRQCVGASASRALSSKRPRNRAHARTIENEARAARDEGRRRQAKAPPKAKPQLDEAEIAKKRAERAAKKPARAAAPRGDLGRGVASSGEKPGPARLRVLFDKEIGPALMKELAYKNPMQVPRLEKIIINMGLGEAMPNPKILDSAVEELAAITGQKPVVTKAKKSIANFKLREGQTIGAMVTLRRERMYEFFDRLVSLALPRVRDFKGVSPQGVRRPRQLLARHPGADHLPGDQLRPRSIRSRG